jgi:hypothetical protein
MPKTPNYDFERQERQRQKALKKADKLAAKDEAKARRGEKPERTQPTAVPSNR